MAKKALTTGGFDALDAELKEEDAGFNPRPVTVKINHQSAEFEIPGVPAVDDLEAVIIAAQKCRVFFPKMGTDALTDELSAFTGKQPFCSSQDYVHGKLADVDWDNKPPTSAEGLKDKIAEGGLFCGQCPLNKWESVTLLGRTGRGKACDDRRRLCLWKEGWNVPVILGVSPSSIRSWDEYCSSLVIGGYRSYHAVTRLTLETVTAPNRKYAVIKFKFKNPITAEMQTELMSKVTMRGEEQTLIKALVDIFNRRELVEDEEYPENGNGTKVAPDADNLGEDF